MNEPDFELATAASLRAALDSAAGALDPIPSIDTAGTRVTWSAAGHPIVIQDGAAASFRVGVEIGPAARRTADAGDSPLGPDWVEFQPGTLDGHARDRLVAWFAAAHRRAG